MMSAGATKENHLGESPPAVELRRIKRNRPNDSLDPKGHLLSKKLEICDHCSREFTSSTTKYSILKEASKLKHSSLYNKVYISPDMTQKERETDKEVWAELKRRLSAGEKDITIR